MPARKLSGNKESAYTEKNWSVYMVRCADTTLYTGISNDVKRRIKMHNTGKGARYIIPARRPVELVYVEEGFDAGAALKRERVIKKSGKTEKEKMAAGKRKTGRSRKMLARVNNPSKR